VSRRVALSFAVLVLASSPFARGQGQAPPGDGPSPGGERRREALRVVDAYVLRNLQESLGLTEAEFVKVLPLVKSLQSERREYLLARVRLLRQLRRQLRSGAAEEVEVRRTLDELKKVETGGAERTRSAAADLDAALTPLQQAKFRVLELEVEQRLRELMGRARERGANERRPPK
jgi:hypothetical protein